ncbi:hypothetical protein [Amycolatopsis sp. NPDC021455]|uniref:hypothetical protein n=1 Tax=Amycolatopsis sp. NPDC021455 TaxID=3154901 RepID=UPI0033F0CB2B
MRKLLVLAVVLLVSACGIKPTPVVSAGPAPTLRSPASDGQSTGVILYFLVDGRLTPVVRPANRTVTVEETLTMLLDGPTVDEHAEGYRTMLPVRTGPVTVTVSPGRPPTISLPFPLRPITGVALNQLACTASAALAVQGGSGVDGTVSFAGPDVLLPYQPCQA